MKRALSSVLIEEIQEESSKQAKDVNMQVYHDSLREIRSKGMVDFFFVLISVFSGAICMSIIEHWKFDDAFYWACVTVILSLNLFFFTLITPFFHRSLTLLSPCFHRSFTLVYPYLTLCNHCFNLLTLCV